MMTARTDALHADVAVDSDAQSEEVLQLHQLPAHVIALGVCASLTPEDVFCSLASTSKRLHGIIREYEAALATHWLSTCTSTPLRVQLVRIRLSCGNRTMYSHHTGLANARAAAPVRQPPHQRSV